VVKPDATVESRPVVIAFANGPLTVIRQGVQAGERVVTDGQLRLVPGARVDVKAAGPAPAPAAPRNPTTAPTGPAGSPR
jgi:multidrug efflux system membrane fusion protein